MSKGTPTMKSHRATCLALFCLLLLLFSGVATAVQNPTAIDFHWVFQRRTAERLFADGKHAEAVAALREVAETAPNDTARAEVLAQAAIARAHADEVDQALADARAIAHETYSRYAVLSILSLKRQHADVLSEFQDEPIADWPERVRARGFEMRGRAFEATEQYREALDDYARCVAAAGDNTARTLPVLMRMARIHHHQLGNLEDAKAGYRRIVALFGDPPSRLRGGHMVFPQALSALARILEAEGHHQEALDALNHFPAAWSTSMGLALLTQRGNLYRDLGKTEQALAAYREALEFAEQRKNHSRAPHFIQRLAGKIEALEKQAAQP